MKRTRRARVLLVFVTVFAVAAGGPAIARDAAADRGDDSDELVPGFAAEPGADLGAYRQVQVLEPSVEFRRGWLRDQNRASIHRVTTADANRLAREVGELVHAVFVEELGGEGGFEVVEEAGAGVLLLRPAIVELDIAAPDLDANGPSRTFSNTNGAATLVLDLEDSGTGRRLARFVDRAVSDNPAHQLRWSNKATNRAAARRMIAGWARQVQEELAARRDPED